MKRLKYLLLSALLILTIGLTTLRAEDKIISPSTLGSLNIQLFNEVKLALESPVYLAYVDKDIKGTASVTYKVLESGKIEVVSVIGDNFVLNEYLSKKLRTQNLWTDLKYVGTQFTYNVVAK